MNVTTPAPSVADRFRSIAATLLALFLVVTGVGYAAPATAAPAASATASVVSATEDGLEVKVDFAEVPTSPLAPPQNTGVYVGIVPAGTTEVLGSGSFVPNALFPSGAGSGTHVVEAGALTAGAAYEALVWYAHGNPTEAAIVARTSLPVTEADWAAVFPASGDEGDSGDAEGEGGSGDEGEGDEGEGDDGDSGEPETSTPVLAVSPNTGLDPEADTVTVTGTGYNPDQAIYVFLCADTELPADLWSHALGCTSGAKVVYPPGSVDRGGNPQPNQFTADGSFAVEFAVKQLGGAATSVFTAASHTGMADRTQDAKATLAFAEAPVFEPTVEVFLADGTTPYTGQKVYEGDELVVKGTGYDPVGNVGGMGMPIPADLPQGTFVVFGSFADDWQPSTGNGTATRVMNNAARQWALAESVLVQVSEPNQSVIRSAWTPIADDGSFTATVKVAAPAAPLADGNWGIYTYPGGVGTPPNAAQEQSVLVDYAGARAPLSATVTEATTDGLMVHVHGEALGDMADAYAAIIEKDTEGDLDTAGGYVAFEMPFPAITDGMIDFEIVAPADKLDRTKTYEVLVWKKHSNPDPENIYARADIAVTPEQWDVIKPVSAPQITVSKATKLDPDGETITVTGAGFGAADGPLGTRPPLFGQPSGVYVAVGAFADDWKPSGGAGSGSRPADSVVWLLPEPSYSMRNPDGTNAQYALIEADGTFEIEVEVSQTAARDGDYGVYTYPGGGATLTSYELFQPLTFTVPPTTPPVTPTGPTTPPASVAGGSLRWSISSSFLSYVTGTIAKGNITVSGGATQSGGRFQFGQASGSTFDGATGTVSYTGAVRLYGHSGALDVTVAHPQVRVTSPSSAALYVTSGGRQVHFATLNLGAASRTTSNGAVTFTNAPASLTSAGASQVLAGYSTTLSPVTFTIGSASAAPVGSSGTVAAAAVAQTHTIPSTPPATDGIDVDAATLDALQAGEQVTITVPGFQPNEQDISVVVYSTPTVLGTVDADASGVASWTGTLPVSVADGEHTLTLQGSVSRGIQFTLDRGAAAVGQCAIDGATLNWGYKESFRTYVEGIARGGWALDGVVYEYPDYVWTGGTGSIDPDTDAGLVDFGGSIRFTGHDGALDMTLADARVELVGTTGYLVFDITGTTQDGEAVEVEGVRFVEFAVPAAVDGVISIDAAPASLTDAGAAAFGTYVAGEEFDPVTATLPVSGDCGEVAPVAPGGEADASGPMAVEPISAQEETWVWPWAVGGIVLVLVAGAVAAIVITRRRAAKSGAAA
ncbi:MAG: HtaA domain-containing protein [Microbacterium sp.]|uniref:HtaA domain-containing protein n=1 Tax=Microbacterium sp. TaxID=51671 RepID=UPI003A8C7A07